MSHANLNFYFQVFFLILNILLLSSSFFKRTFVLLGVLILSLYFQYMALLGRYINIIPISFITLFNVLTYIERTKVFKRIKEDFTETKYSHLHTFLNDYNLDNTSFLSLLKEYKIKSMEVVSSFLILLSSFTALFISPIISMILILSIYLISVLLKGTVKVALNKPYINSYLFNNVELELRLGNRRILDRIVHKYSKDL